MVSQITANNKFVIVVVQSLSRVWLCDPWTPGFPDLAQTHAHWISDAIQPSHPLLWSTEI